MTSGVFTHVSIDAIQIAPDRQRKEMGDIEVLADSIRRLGLIHPILVTKDLVLIAGERRYRACLSLGWTQIPVQFEGSEEDADEERLFALELEENVKRQDITWQETTAAINKYHSLRSAEYPEWSQSDTAAALGLSRNVISRHLIVAKELEVGNEAVVTAPKFTTAYGLAERRRSRAEAATILAVTQDAPAAEVPSDTTFKEYILVEDFTKWAEIYQGPKFNLIHCDFPYGVGANKIQQGSTVAEFGSYSDTAEDYFTLLETLCSKVDNFVAESAHLMFWFSMDFYAETLAALTRGGWRVNAFPLIWFKSDHTGILPDPQRGPRRIYETAFLASRGDRKIVRAVSNVAAAPSSTTIHMSEKSPVMLEAFMRMLVDESTAILDPTAGSGNAIRVARRLGASRMLGLEINPEFARRANDQLRRDEESPAEGESNG